MNKTNFNTIYNNLFKVIKELSYIKEHECEAVKGPILDLRDIGKDIRHLQDKVFEIHGDLLDKYK